mmetsp:Transcript_6471/g.11016  ORF Transcript_6471/g.11016 Transcript_6471/m.11016 type:complete len:212 (+) Transcript_6471:1-636(+)
MMMIIMQVLFRSELDVHVALYSAEWSAVRLGCSQAASIQNADRCPIIVILVIIIVTVFSAILAICLGEARLGIEGKCWNHVVRSVKVKLAWMEAIDLSVGRDLMQSAEVKFEAHRLVPGKRGGGRDRSWSCCGAWRACGANLWQRRQSAIFRRRLRRCRRTWHGGRWQVLPFGHFHLLYLRSSWSRSAISNTACTSCAAARVAVSPCCTLS